MTQHQLYEYALAGLDGQPFIPIKEEEKAEVSTLEVDPHIADATSNASLFSRSESDDDGDGDDIEPTPNDVVCSLLDEEYKNNLAEHIDKLAEMKQRGDELNMKDRTDALMKRFQEKIGTNGRYLQRDRSAKEYYEIDAGQARKKIGNDLRREVNVVLKKRRQSESSRSPSNEKKRHKPTKQSTGASNSSSLDASSGTLVRPKRGVQQLLYRNMPYAERLDVGSNPVGMPVGSYSINPDFKPKSIKTDEEKRVCAGQAFVKFLTENNRAEWIVRKCQDENGNWDYVTYKGCNRCNSKEQEAIEGKDKFTGYDAVAKFVLKTGLRDELIKKSKDIVDLFKTLGLSCKIDNEVVVQQQQQQADTVAVSSACNNGAKNLSTPRSVQAAPQAMITTNNGNQNQAAFLVENNTTAPPPAAAAAITGAALTDTRDPSTPKDVDMYLEKRKELVKAMKVVKEKFDNARTSFLGDEHNWKHDKMIDFYNTLQRAITGYAKRSSAIRSFEFDNIKRMMEAFDEDMVNLTQAEEKGDENYIEFYQGIIESSIEEAKELFLPKLR